MRQFDKKNGPCIIERLPPKLPSKLSFFTTAFGNCLGFDVVRSRYDPLIKLGALFLLASLFIDFIYRMYIYMPLTDFHCKGKYVSYKNAILHLFGTISDKPVV